MKKLFTILAAILFMASVFLPQQIIAQAPVKMSYQAVIRNSSNQLVTNKAVGMKISILRGYITGSEVYVEKYNPNPTTNANGLVSVEIGGGVPILGTFTAIDWAAGPYFIKTETDPSGATNYNITGTSQLLSVPYALHAKSASLLSLPYIGLVNNLNTGFSVSNLGGVAIAGNTDKTAGKTIGVSGTNNSTEGIGVYGLSTPLAGINYGVQGEARSENSIGVKGINVSLAGSSTGVLGEVASDFGMGVVGYATSATGSAKGVYGYSKALDGIGVSGESNYIGVTGIVHSKTAYAYGVIGQVYSPFGKGVTGNSLSETGASVGVYGTSISTTGIGVDGSNSAVSGVTKGVQGLVNSPDGYSGYFSGGKFYIKGNTGIGTENPGAGIHLKGTGFPNTFMFLESATGNDAGFRIYEGSTPKWHIFNNVTAGGLQVYNSAAVTAIFCKQSNSFVGINTLTPAYNLEVNGTAGKTGGGSWTTSSDIRLKNVSGNYNKGLTEITALQPVRFTYKEGNPRNLPSNQEQIGFVAQDVQKVFPEAVNKAEDGYLDFNIHSINVALVNAVKELKAENDLLRSRLEKIETQMKLKFEK